VFRHSTQKHREAVSVCGPMCGPCGPLSTVAGATDSVPSNWRSILYQHGAPCWRPL
jgi:hypothetical protein